MPRALSNGRPAASRSSATDWIAMGNTSKSGRDVLIEVPDRAFEVRGRQGTATVETRLQALLDTFELSLVFGIECEAQVAVSDHIRMLRVGDSTRKAPLHIDRADI